MNFLQRLLLRLLSPALAREREADREQFDWERDVRLRLTERIRAHGREHATLRGAINNICDQRDLALESLLALVARDEAGDWTTVFDADTRVTQELSDYLDTLVARA